MKIGIIADDFTGASDIALTLAEAGMTVAQFVGVPNASADPALDAGVVALKSRTAPVVDAVEQSLAACDWLLGQGVKQIVIKVCSTVDSTPKGNIGPVLDALMMRIGPGPVIVCPAFPENGRTVYQGHLFVNDVLLNESGMQNHPLTPMKDADLRRVLGAQSTHDVAHVPAVVVALGADALRAALPRKGPVIVDAIRDADLMQIGLAAAGLPLLCGGSGIALGLPYNFGATPRQPEWQAVHGDGVIISGSCSAATRQQVRIFQTTNPSFEVSAEDAISGSVTAESITDWVKAQDKVPMVFSSADPSNVSAAQEKFGREKSAAAIENLFADLAASLAERGTTRIVVAGGETSGTVVNGLNARVLKIGPRIAAGVPVVRLGDRDIALALKSGNFGAPDFFQTALDVMQRPA